MSGDAEFQVLVFGGILKNPGEFPPGFLRLLFFFLFFSGNKKESTCTQ